MCNGAYNENQVSLDRMKKHNYEQQINLEW